MSVVWIEGYYWYDRNSLIMGYLNRDNFLAEYAYNGVLDLRKILHSLICMMMLLERLL